MFKKGDCIIINYCDAPIARNVCVITSIRNGVYFYKYLNANPLLNRFNRPPMRGQLKEATLLSDFGVRLVMQGCDYWCQQVAYSTATYQDGLPRKWQDTYDPVHVARPDVARAVRQ